MTGEILKITKIGVTVSKLKKTNEKAKALVKGWMKIYEESKAAKSKEAVTSTKQAEASPSTESKSSVTVPSEVKEAAVNIEHSASLDEEDDDMRRHVRSLPEGRRKVIEHFKDILRQDATSLSTSIAFALASSIEASIDDLLPFHKDAKAYGSKVRTLAFNIKKNEQLRIEIINGGLPPNALVHMSPNDLATEEQKKQRQQATKADIDARRSDYYTVNRSNILKSIGLDPTKGGEFTCRKCNQNKTTHYSLQTRSADEPMTVFVTCLTCSNRWKTN